MPDASTSWREVSSEELRRALDCSALSREAGNRVRGEFKAASIRAITVLAQHLGRAPSQTEADWIHAKLVDWFNEERIPLIVPGVVH